MKVVATAKGYYGGQIRRIGDVFDVPDNVCGAWFTSVMPEDFNLADINKSKNKTGTKSV